MTNPPPVSLSPAIVTGGCGFTGSHMVEGLLQHEENAQVHVIARDVRSQIPGVTYHTCDISSLDEVQVSLPVAPSNLFLVVLIASAEQSTHKTRFF